MNRLRALGIQTVPRVNYPADKVAKVQALYALPKHEREAAWDSIPAAELAELRRIRDALLIERPEFNAGVKAKAERICASVDMMSAELRQAVYRHGHSIVQGFVQHGIRKAKSIDYLVALAQRINFGDGSQGHYGNHRNASTRRLQNGGSA